RPERVAGDVLVADLLGEAVGDERHPELRDGVGNLPGRVRRLDGRRHHEDVAVALLQHRRKHVVGAGEGPARVHAHDEVEALHRRLEHRAPVERAGVVDEEVDPAHLVERRLDAALDLGVVAHIHLHGERSSTELLHLGRGVVDGAGEARVGLDGLGGSDDVTALAGEGERDVLADAAGGAGDEGHAIGEFHAAKPTRDETSRSFRGVLRSSPADGGQRMRKTPKWLGAALVCGAAAAGCVSAPETAPETGAPERRPTPTEARFPSRPRATLRPAGALQRKIEAAVESHFGRTATRRGYIMTDKPLYQPGETIWFRADLRQTATFAPAGNVGVNMQLVSPPGAVVLPKPVLATD